MGHCIHVRQGPNQLVARRVTSRVPVAIVTLVVNTVVDSWSLKNFAVALSGILNVTPVMVVVRIPDSLTEPRESIPLIAKNTLFVSQTAPAPIVTQSKTRALVSSVGIKQFTTWRVFVLVNLNPPASAFAEPVLATTGISSLSEPVNDSSVSEAGVIAFSSMPADVQAGKIPGEVVKVNFPVAGTVSMTLNELTALAGAITKAPIAQAATAAMRALRRLNIGCSSNQGCSGKNPSVTPRVPASHFCGKRCWSEINE